MESLLRLSGLLSQDDDGKTDLGTLESKLAYKVHGSSTEGSSKQSDREASVSVREDSVSAHEFSHRTNATSPQSTVSQEQASAKKSEEEVEALSDMMCSLVTNNHGETKYIGMTEVRLSGDIAIISAYNVLRLVLGLFDLLSKGYPMG